MLTVKDAMVVIHLAKITLLENSCKHFKQVIIPQKVYSEIIKGEEQGYPEVPIIKQIINSNKISVKSVKNKLLIKKANEFNIQHGESEAVALYWQEKANYLATDDNNVRKKSVQLNINIIGTPAIIRMLYQKKLIDKEKYKQSLSKLREIGWFDNILIDKMINDM